MKRRILNWLLKDLFNAVTEDSFLEIRFKNKEGTVGDILQGGKPLNGAEVAELSSQARVITKRFSVWRKLVDSMTWKANERMYWKAQNHEDMIFGKAVLWTLEVMEAKLENMARLSGTAVPEDPEFKPLKKK